MNFMKNCRMYEIRKLVVSETINNQFHFSDVGNKRFGKIKYIRFLALAPLFLGFRQNKKKFGTVTWIISDNFCLVNFALR